MRKSVNEFLNLGAGADIEIVWQAILYLEEQYPFLECRILGSSILGASLPVLRIGRGEKGVLLVGVHSATEGMISAVLLRFAKELCYGYEQGQKQYDIDIKTMLLTRSLYIVPMLNADGVEYVRFGLTQENPLRNRVLSMNGGSDDLSRWQANARGVELTRNYDAGFLAYKKAEGSLGIMNGAPRGYSGTCAESEPEVRALCNFLRYHEQIRLTVSFESFGEQIRHSGRVDTQRMEHMTSLAARWSGFESVCTEEIGGLSDWVTQGLDREAFTVACGKGGEGICADNAGVIYRNLREFLFRCPTLL